MGNDGGSINKNVRIRVVQEKNNGEETGKQSEYCWTNCRLSGQPLKPPLFSDYKGNLFNKEAILEWLLVKPEYKAEEYTQVMIDAFSHIRLRKDVVEITNLRRLENGAIGITLSAIDSDTTDLVLGVRRKSAYIDICGHVNTLNSLDKNTECFLCGAHYGPSNVVIINPSDPEDIERLEKRYQSLVDQKLSHSRKAKAKSKTKKRKTTAVHPSDDAKKHKVAAPEKETTQQN